MTEENNSKLYNLAPIVLFVYNRPDHTRQTVEALQKNELASESELFIYSDGPKNKNDEAKVNKVREYISSIDGFKKITIIKREKNWGLADSIIDGVTKIVNEYGKIIVLEDDLVTSPYFLKFMNEALEFYKDEKRVWHVSGWNYPIETHGLDDVFMWRLMNCWGWATWADRWKYYEKDSNKLLKEFSKEQVKYLNLDGLNDAWSQVVSNKDGRINTWAIYWYATIVKNKGMCLNPSQTFVLNIGHDGSGVHCGNSDIFVSGLSLKKNTQWIKSYTENIIALERIKSFYRSQKKSILSRIMSKFSIFIVKKLKVLK